MRKFFAELSAVLLMAILGGGLGFAYAHFEMGRQCRDFGAFKHQGKIYRCEPEGPKQVARRVVV